MQRVRRRFVARGERIGCIGHSLGGHNSLFTAVFDSRIKIVVTSCGFDAFRDLLLSNAQQFEEIIGREPRGIARVWRDIGVEPVSVVEQTHPDFARSEFDDLVTERFVVFVRNALERMAPEKRAEQLRQVVVQFAALRFFASVLFVCHAAHGRN
jgi:hypothetical protein